MKRWRVLLAALLCVCVCLAAVWPAQTYAGTKYKSEWVEKNGRYYYFDKTGTKLTGLQKIGSKTYYFDEKGRERCGWVEIDGSYYFFEIRHKKNAAMVTDTTVNGITILKSGKAKVTESNKEKLRLLVAANELVFENTKSTMYKKEKLRVMFEGYANADLIVYKNLGKFKKSESSWQEVYAAYAFDKGYGDCYAAACAFAYIATAIGYDEVYAQSSGGHGWCKINGKYYDPNWAWWGTKNIDKAYAVPADLSGKDGRPRWSKNETYSKKISG